MHVSPRRAADITPVDALDQLLRHAGSFPLLRPEEEIELAKRIERGDLAAKERMVNSNIRLVVSIARRYQGHGLSLNDLVQEGMLGLIRAAEKFDWRKGFRFSTYATLWIRQAMQRGLDNSGRIIRLPAHMAGRARRIARARSELITRHEREPTMEELAAATELEVDEVERLVSLDYTPPSLDQNVGTEGDTTLGALQADDAPPLEDEVHRAAMAVRVAEALQTLPDDERSVIELRYGLGSKPDAEVPPPHRRRALEESALRRLEKIPELEALREAA